MWMSEHDRRVIVALVAARFPTFGGVVAEDERNPIKIATEGKPPCFAACVDVRQVVDCVVDSITKARI